MMEGRKDERNEGRNLVAGCPRALQDDLVPLFVSVGGVKNHGRVGIEPLHFGRRLCVSWNDAKRCWHLSQNVGGERVQARAG